MRICDDLRQAVLQAAIQGKLTKQLPEDGNAADLLKLIAAEKAKLTKEGKIKKEKPLPEISPDEIPFNIPNNWQWVKLGECGYTNIGLTYRPNNINSDGTVVLRSNNIKNGKMDYSDLVRVKMDIPKNKICKIGDILICARNGSKRLVGKSAIIDRENMSFGAFMAIFRTRFNYYINYLIQSPYFRESVLGDAGTTTINQLTQDMLKNFICPLPPLTEQQRIVAKVDELMSQIDDLEKMETELEKLKAAFPGDMKAALLQAAMQGKLTEQLPEDGDAADLINQIAKEKSHLIKKGKIKKEKPLPEITPDEVPFDIPENWCWCRFIDTFNVRSALRIHQSDWKTEGVPFLRGRELVQLSKTGQLKSDVFITEEFYDELKCKGGIPRKDDVLITAVGTLGKVYVINGDEGRFYYKDAYILCLENYGLNPYYVKYVLESPFSQAVIYDATSKGTTVAQLTIIKLKGMLLPLPPLAEQKRIVEKLDKLLPLCDGLIEE